MSRAPWLVTLATWQGWAVVADFEEVAIRNPDGVYWRIGSMYGNPEAALLTMDSKYAVVIGDGFIVADLSRFGEPVQDLEDWGRSAAVYCLARQSSPWSSGWWFEAVYEPGYEGIVRLVGDMHGARAGVYELRLPDLTLTPLLIRSESPS